MITIFTIPKPFVGVTGIQQRNAIESWKRLEPKCEIILCGNDPTIGLEAVSLGVGSLTNVETNEYGTPFLDFIFEQIISIARFPILCYINSDIILLDQITKIVQRIKFHRFLAVGQRTNLDLNSPIEFSNHAWHADLKKLAAERGELAQAHWIDYFIFTSNSGLQKIPHFLVGRPRWDNWFIYNALQKRVPVVDITQVCVALHQNHEYSHIPEWKGKSWAGPEANYNEALYLKLVGSKKFLSIQDASYVLTPDKIKSAFRRNDLYHHLQTEAVLYPFLRPIAKLATDMYELKQKHSAKRDLP